MEIFNENELLVDLEKDSFPNIHKNDTLEQLSNTTNFLKLYNKETGKMRAYFSKKKERVAHLKQNEVEELLQACSPNFQNEGAKIDKIEGERRDPLDFLPKVSFSKFYKLSFILSFSFFFCIQLFKVMFFFVLSKLSPKQVGRCFLVSKKWYGILTNNLWSSLNSIRFPWVKTTPESAKETYIDLAESIWNPKPSVSLAGEK